MLHPVHDDGPGGAVEDEAGDAQGVGVGVHIGARHDELVVGHPGHDVGLAAGHRQPARHLPGHLLGGAGPELLVDVLPAVELDEQHGQRAPGPLGRRRAPASSWSSTRARLGGSASDLSAGLGRRGRPRAVPPRPAPGGGRRGRLGLGRHVLDDPAQAVVLDGEGPLRQRVADGLDEGLGDEGLHEQPVEVGRRGQRAVERGQAREEQDRRVGVLFLEPAGQLHPGVVGELVVDDDRGGVLQAVQGQRLGRVRGHEHLDARPLEHGRQALPGGLIVVDDQDRVL